jgi:hypothetical protein
VEGLFLSAWTHWEQFVRELLIVDLASTGQSSLLSEVKKFRTKGAPHRLASLILDHPDENRWVEWSQIPDIVRRANVYLAANHRFVCLAGLQPTFDILSPMRNAVAHKSDVAWRKFRGLVQRPPFALQPRQMKGITVGRFLTSHNWNNQRVIDEILAHLRRAASALVP